MEAIELLEKYKKTVDQCLKSYFELKIKQADKADPLAGEAVKMIADFTLSGGKRIRPALVYYGYLALGGKPGFEIIEASMGIELTHSFFLIHDDIIDRDETRHGVATLHEQYKKIGQKIAPRKDNHHFGNSMAMIAGDMAAAMANEIMFNAKFPPEIIIRALDKLQNIVYVTIPGEMLDVVLEMKGGAKEEEIMRMYEGKTSRYTFEGPLHLGAILFGANDKQLRSFSDYAIPLGKAFQIQDDILGVFGDEQKLGKPVGSDVIEGKQTVLVARIMEKGANGQKEIVKKYLGKRDLSKDELELFRQAVRESGALEYARELAKKLVGEALEALSKIEFKNEDAKEFLGGIASYIVEREK